MLFFMNPASVDVLVLPRFSSMPRGKKLLSGPCMPQSTSSYPDLQSTKCCSFLTSLFQMLCCPDIFQMLQYYMHSPPRCLLLFHSSRFWFWGFLLETVGQEKPWKLDDMDKVPKNCLNIWATKKPSYFPLNPGWLIGILIMVHCKSLYNWVVWHPLCDPTNQGFFSCLIWIPLLYMHIGRSLDNSSASTWDRCLVGNKQCIHFTRIRIAISAHDPGFRSSD